MAPDIVESVVISKQAIDEKTNVEVIEPNRTSALHKRNTTNNNIDTINSNKTNDIKCDKNSENTDKEVINNNEIFQPKIRWPDLVVQIFLHVGALYGFLILFWSIKLYTFLWCK